MSLSRQRAFQVFGDPEFPIAQSRIQFRPTTMTQSTDYFKALKFFNNLIKPEDIPAFALPLVIICPALHEDPRNLALVVERAKDLGLRVSARSGGYHSGFSSTLSVVKPQKGSIDKSHDLQEEYILLDLKHQTNVIINPTSQIAIVEPGTTAGDLYNQAIRFGLHFPGPHATRLTMGGFLLQGGMGIGARLLGTGAENVVGYDMISASGDLFHVDKHHHEDIFWALRGGGQFLGLITRFYLRLRPIVQVPTVVQTFGAKTVSINQIAAIATMSTATGATAATAATAAAAAATTTITTTTVVNDVEKNNSNSTSNTSSSSREMFVDMLALYQEFDWQAPIALENKLVFVQDNTQSIKKSLLLFASQSLKPFNTCPQVREAHDQLALNLEAIPGVEISPERSTTYNDLIHASDASWDSDTLSYYAEDLWITGPLTREFCHELVRVWENVPSHRSCIALNTGPWPMQENEGKPSSTSLGFKKSYSLCLISMWDANQVDADFVATDSSVAAAQKQWKQANVKWLDDAIESLKPWTLGSYANELRPQHVAFCGQDHPSATAGYWSKCYEPKDFDKLLKVKHQLDPTHVFKSLV